MWKFLEDNKKEIPWDVAVLAVPFVCRSLILDRSQPIGLAHALYVWIGLWPDLSARVVPSPTSQHFELLVPIYSERGDIPNGRSRTEWVD